MFATPAAGLFVAGQIDQGTPATQSAAADTAVELAAPAIIANSDITASRADLDTTSDPLVADTAAGGYRFESCGVYFNSRQRKA